MSFEKIDGYRDELVSLRRDFHRHPELAFEERRTAGRVAELLRSYGYEVHTGLADTGVVGVLRAGAASGDAAGRCRTIGLRADMDALPIEELNQFDHRSSHPGKMHACGHDGHTTMLLGAARYLAETRRFDGCVVLIFQPAEENGGGAQVMIEQGLFERFPVDAVYGMHNMPGMPLGDFALRSGPMLAAVDIFEAAVICRGGHAAMPHLAEDAVLVACQVVQAWQGIVSRNVDPLASAVVSTTCIHGGEASNVLPERVVLRGCVRTFDEPVQALVEERMRRLGTAIAEASGMRFELDYRRTYPATVNHAAQSERFADAAAEVGERVERELPPIMGSEDFSFMLRARPGAFLMAGQGEGAGLHTPYYDFNDDLLTLGAKLWARLVERELPLGR